MIRNGYSSASICSFFKQEDSNTESRATNLHLEIVVLLLMGLFKMLHEHGDDHINQDKLGHEDKDDKVKRGDDRRNAAVPNAVGGSVAFIPQSVLHDPVPVVTGGHAKQR